MRKWVAERKIDCYGKNMAIKVSGVAICDFVPSIKRKVQKMFCPTQCFCLLFLSLFWIGLLRPQSLSIFLSHLPSSTFLTCLILGWVGALLSRAAVAAPPLFITIIQPTLSDPGQLPTLCNGTDGAGEEKG